MSALYFLTAIKLLNKYSHGVQEEYSDKYTFMNFAPFSLLQVFNVSWLIFIYSISRYILVDKLRLSAAFNMIRIRVTSRCDFLTGPIFKIIFNIHNI